MVKRSICHCRGCNASILFMYTADKKLIPVDYKPSLDKLDQYDPKIMVSHFATCPKGADFKKKKGFK